MKGIKSDAWDNGNYLTRFYEPSEPMTCPECFGRKYIQKTNSRGAIYTQKCDNCDGKGEVR